MNPIIVYVDDATYAQPMLEALAGSGQAASSHWLLVACAPRMTHRVSKWVSHRARENWRGKWADKLFTALMPVMSAAGGKVTPVLAKGPLTELVAELQPYIKGKGTLWFKLDESLPIDTFTAEHLVFLESMASEYRERYR